MFRDLVQASGCGAARSTMTWDDFVAKVSASPLHEPAGIVFHEGRVGSTLVANMLTAVPNAIVYSESTPPTALSSLSSAPREVRLQALRYIVSAMLDVPGSSAGFFKMQSAMGYYMADIAAAFPNTPLMFLYRDPIEVQASMFNSLYTAGRPGGQQRASKHSPCTRHQLPGHVPEQLAQLAGGAQAALALSPEEYCAVHLAALRTMAKDVVLADGATGGILNYVVMPAAIPDALAQYFKLDMDDATRAAMMRVSLDYSKARSSSHRPNMDTEGHFKEDAEAKRSAVSDAMRQASIKHLRDLHLEMNALLLDVQWLPEAGRAVLTAEQTRWQGSRALQQAPRTLYDLAAAAHLLASQRDGGVPGSRRLGLEETGRGAGRPASVEPAAIWPDDMQNPPVDSPATKVQADAEGKPPADYPELFSMLQMLEDWPVDEVRIPVDYGHDTSIRAFEFSSEQDMAQARIWREMEVPFLVKNVPNVKEHATKWTDEYLSSKFGNTGKLTEYNMGNHFMYYYPTKGAQPAERPTQPTYMTYEEWRGHSKSVTQAIFEEGKAQSEVPHWYMRVSAHAKTPGQKLRGEASGSSLFANRWIGEELDIFAAEKSFWIPDPKRQMGIHCRIGMPGIIAESHYDAGRNFIAMSRGAKRYILSPPDECGNLDMLTSGPSARHSASNWSDVSQVKEKMAAAKATQVVLQAGDVLYVPAGWFHFIVTLTDVSFQCNSRSGNPALGQLEVLAGCDLPVPQAAQYETRRHATELKAALAAYKGLASS